MTSSLTVVVVCLVMSVQDTGAKPVREVDVDSLSVAVDRLASEVTSLQAQVHLIETNLNTGQSGAQTIAFSASVAEDTPGTKFIHASEGIIPFGHVITNVGGGYKPALSAFEAPVDGVYMFYVRVDISADYRAVILSRNGNFFIVGHNDGNMRFISCGATISLRAGDAVAVYHGSSTGSIDGGLESSFSGFKIN